jgi:iron-sulfur cluster assembly protein
LSARTTGWIDPTQGKARIMFNITPAASAELLAAAVRSDAQGMALRVAARALADGSIEYGMGFDDERENDESAEYNGLTVLLGAKSRPYLASTVLDYVEVEPGRFDFVFVQTEEARGAEDVGGAPGGGGCGSGGCGRCG